MAPVSELMLVLKSELMFALIMGPRCRHDDRLDAQMSELVSVLRSLQNNRNISFSHLLWGHAVFLSIAVITN